MNKHALGVVFAIVSGAAWGFSGSCGQLLFQDYSLDPLFACSARVAIAAVCLLAISFARKGREVVEPLRSWKSFTGIVVYAVFGVLLMQLSYLLAIKNSNAGTATALEFIGPVIVVLIVCVYSRKLPDKREFTAVMCVVVGTFLLATHGDPGKLVLSPAGLFWGLTCAGTMALFALLPVPLVKRFDVTVVLAWAFTIDSLIMGALYQPWTHVPTMGIDGWVALVVGLALFGTVLSFVLYSQAIKWIGPSSTSMLGSVEVVMATVLSACWLGSSFTIVDLVGILMIASTAIILGKDKESNAKEPAAEQLEASSESC